MEPPNLSDSKQCLSYYGTDPEGIITSHASALAPVTACIRGSKACALWVVGWLGVQLSTFAQADIVTCSCAIDTTVSTTTTMLTPATTNTAPKTDSTAAMTTIISLATDVRSTTSAN